MYSASTERRRDTYTDTSAKHEKSQNELCQHADNNGVPDNLATVTGREPEAEEEDDETEAGNSTIGAGVIRIIWLNESAETNDSDSSDGAEWETQAFWNDGDSATDNVGPEEFDRDHEVAGWNVEGDETHHDEEPQEEGDDPAEVTPVEDNTCNPPSSIVLAELSNFSFAIMLPL